MSTPNRKEKILVKELGWELIEKVSTYGAYKMLMLYSPYNNSTGWELTVTFNEKVNLNRKAIDDVMNIDCPNVIKNALMAYVIMGMI